MFQAATLHHPSGLETSALNTTRLWRFIFTEKTLVFPYGSQITTGTSGLPPQWHQNYLGVAPWIPNYLKAASTKPTGTSGLPHGDPGAQITSGLSPQVPQGVHKSPQGRQITLGTPNYLQATQNHLRVSPRIPQGPKLLQGFPPQPQITSALPPDPSRPAVTSGPPPQLPGGTPPASPAGPAGTSVLPPGPGAAPGLSPVTHRPGHGGSGGPAPGGPAGRSLRRRGATPIYACVTPPLCGPARARRGPLPLRTRGPALRAPRPTTCAHARESRWRDRWGPGGPDRDRETPRDLDNA